jgi:hypothetical protein
MLAVVVVLAGCGSLTGGPAERPTLSESVTPAPVPTTSSPAASEPDSIRAFLEDSENGPARLAARHRQVLGRTSYRIVVTQSVVAGDQPLRQLNRSVRVAESGETYTLRQTTTVAEAFTTSDVDRTQLGVYRDGLDGWFRTVRGNETRYGRLRTTLQGPEVDLTASDDVRQVLRAFDGVSIDLDMSPWVMQYRVRAVTLTRPTGLTLPPGLDDPREARLTMIVTSEGVVQSYDLTYLARYDGEIVRVRQRMAVTGRGQTAVPEPAWIPDARAATEGAEGSGRNST